jgi:hypothetical protein
MLRDHRTPPRRLPIGEALAKIEEIAVVLRLSDAERVELERRLVREAELREHN